MINKQALTEATKDYWERKSDVQNYSYESGCHGVIGSGEEENLLETFLKDYLEYDSEKGKNKKPYKSTPSAPKGKYVNSPEWN